MKDFIKEHRKKFYWGLGWLVGSALVVYAAHWMVEWYTSEWGVSDKLEFEKFKATLIGGVVVIFQLMFFAVRAFAAEKIAEATESGNVAERFKNAIEHLGNESASVRVGGIYALHNIAKENKKYRKQIFEILCTHIREKTTSDTYELIKVGEIQMVPVEIQSIVNVLFKSEGESIYKDLKAELDYVDLREVDWGDTDLGGALLRGANMQGANFVNADLSNVKLQYANLEGAKFRLVDLKNAELWRTNLEEAKFIQSNLQDAYLHRANLKNALFSNANLKKAAFWKADLQGASFHSTNLEKVNFQYANLLDIELEIKQLLNAETFHDAKLSEKLKSYINKQAPKLLDVYTTPIVLPTAVLEKYSPQEKSTYYVISMLHITSDGQVVRIYKSKSP